MCVIIASPSGRKPDFEIFEDAASTNRDGIGLAWKDKDKILFKKGTTLEELRKLMEDTVKEAWVAHFRIATVGDKTGELTHPFIVSNDSPLLLEGEAKSVLFQNGTFSRWEDDLLKACAHSGVRIPDGDWSDSRASAVLVSIYGRNILRFLGNHSRYLLFSNGDVTNPDLKTPVWYTGDWHIHQPTGLHFSNRGGSIWHERKPEYQQSSFLRDERQAESRAPAQVHQSRPVPPRLAITRKRSYKGTRSPWTFFNQAGIPEVDGVSEALDIQTDSRTEGAKQVVAEAK